VPPGELEAETRRLVERLSSGQTRACGLIRVWSMPRSATRSRLRARLEAETCSKAAMTEDLVEGIGVPGKPRRFHGR
jgi:hypothetical protein